MVRSSPQPGSGGVPPIGHVVRRQCDAGEHEYGPLGRDLDPDRHDRGNRPEAGFVEAEKAGRLAAQAVGGELRGRLAVEVQPEGITEREAPARGPHGELDPPGADDAVNGEQRQGKKVAHAAVSRSSRPAGR